MDDDSDSSSEACIEEESKQRQRKLKARRARRRTRVHSELLKSASAGTMLEKLAVTTRTRVRYTQSRERLFSLLDLTEHTMMELADATLDRQKCELFTQLCLGGEQRGCGEHMMAGLFGAFPTFSRMGAQRLPRTLRSLKAWRCLTPSRRRKALMLGCWDSRSSTLLAARRCDPVKPAKGGSRFSALLQHPQEEARPSKTQRYDGMPPEVCATTDHSGISRTHKWPMQYSKLLQKLGPEQQPSASIVTRASVDMAPQCRTLDAVQKRGAWSQAKSTHRYEQHTTENCFPKFEHYAKNVKKNTFDKPCWGRVILCNEHDKN